MVGPCVHAEGAGECKRVVQGCFNGDRGCSQALTLGVRGCTQCLRTCTFCANAEMRDSASAHTPHGCESLRGCACTQST